MTSAATPWMMPFSSQPMENSISMGWRLGWIRMLSARVSFTFTGRLVRYAIRAAWCWTVTSSLPPKPPPTRQLRTFTFSAGNPSIPMVSCWVS